MAKLTSDRGDTTLPTISDVDYAPILGAADGQGFSLSTGRADDYACFAIWNEALSKQDEILADLGAHFDILGDFEIHWSDQHYYRNINRLYERVGGFGALDGWDEKIGPTPFRFVVVRNRDPQYTWKQSVSGAIEPSNEKVVAAKYRYRNWFEKPYQIHSSNNISELLIQIALLLGAERAERVLGATECITEVLHKDLEGADGWDSWKQLFSVLNMGCKYLVLRNYEGLPDRLEDADVDFLCDNFQRLASAANVVQFEDRPFKGDMMVGGDQISVDIRYVGDGYYPAPWQVDMLQRRRTLDGFFVPAPDDLFFSMFYHCKIQKPVVKPKYVPKLTALADELRFSWFDPEILGDDEKSARLLAGYMRARGFTFEDPVDKGVHSNEVIIEALPHRFENLSQSEKRNKALRQKVKKAMRDPQLIAPYILQKLKLTRPT